MQTFRDYMEEALYTPGAGFYSRRTPTADFYTAPELHPAFGATLAGELARRLELLRERGVPGPYSLVEMGSGDGSLAAQVLGELRARHPAWAQEARFILVERCRETLLESVLSLSAAGHKVQGCSTLDELPPSAGVFYSNELVDAFPVHLLEMREGAVREVFVEASGAERPGPLSTRELEPQARSVAESLLEGERHAVNLEALRWLRAVSEKLTDGWLLTIDYGKRFNGQPNPPRAFRRHAVDERLTDAKGLKDLTASVDFEALIAEGRKSGMALESYQTLGRFLLDRGVERWLEPAVEGAGAAQAFKARAQVKTLIHPEGMGEVFKVLVQRKETGRGAEAPSSWLHQEAP